MQASRANPSSSLYEKCARCTVCRTRSSRSASKNRGSRMTCEASNDRRMTSSASGGSVQTKAARVSCSMPRDYNDPAPLRLLAALVTGDRVAPPALHEPGPFLEIAREHRVERIAAWRIAESDGDLEAWFGSEAAG